MDVRTDEPQTITATHPAAIMIGQTVFSISNATCLDGKATLFIDDEIIAHGQLVNGAVTLSLDPASVSVGTAVLPITSHNYRPYQADVEIIENWPIILLAPADGAILPPLPALENGYWTLPDRDSLRNM